MAGQVEPGADQSGRVGSDQPRSFRSAEKHGDDVALVLLVLVSFHRYHFHDADTRHKALLDCRRQRRAVPWLPIPDLADGPAAGRPVSHNLTISVSKVT